MNKPIEAGPRLKDPMAKEEGPKSAAGPKGWKTGPGIPGDPWKIPPDLGPDKL